MTLSKALLIEHEQAAGAAWAGMLMWLSHPMVESYGFHIGGVA